MTIRAVFKRAVKIEITELIDIAYGQFGTLLSWWITKVIIIANRLHKAQMQHNVSKIHQSSRALNIRVNFCALLLRPLEWDLGRLCTVIVGPESLTLESIFALFSERLVIGVSIEVGEAKGTFISGVKECWGWASCTGVYTMCSVEGFSLIILWSKSPGIINLYRAAKYMHSTHGNDGGKYIFGNGIGTSSLRKALCFHMQSNILPALRNREHNIICRLQRGC